MRESTISVTRAKFFIKVLSKLFSVSPRLSCFFSFGCSNRFTFDDLMFIVKFCYCDQFRLHFTSGTYFYAPLLYVSRVA